MDGTADASLFSVLTEALNEIRVYANPNLILTGEVSDIPSSVVRFYAYNSGAAITGELSDIPSSMLRFYVYDSDVDITAGTSAINATGLVSIRLDNTGRTQTEVDDILCRFSTDKALFTYTYPSINVSGDNAAPSATGLTCESDLETASWTVTVTGE